METLSGNIYTIAMVEYRRVLFFWLSKMNDLETRPRVDTGCVMLGSDA